MPLLRHLLVTVIFLFGCLSSGPAQAMRVECNVASIAGPNGSIADSWMICEEVGGDPVVPSDPAAAARWMEALAKAERTKPSAPRGGPQENGGGTVDGTDPIEFHGEFRIRETDLSFPGLGSNFQFSRSYSSFSPYFGVLGHGWSHHYQKALVSVGDGTCSGNIEFVDGDGSVRFHHDPLNLDSYVPDENGIGYRLRRDGSEYILEDGSGLSYVFKDDRPKTYTWKPLVAIRDALGHEQKIEWTAYDEVRWPQARIVSVKDTTGRVVYFNYKEEAYQDEKGAAKKKFFLSCLSAAKDDCNTPYVSFEYNALGELKTVKDALGRGDTYTYDDGHAIERGLPTADADRLCSSLCGPHEKDCRNEDICSQRSFDRLSQACKDNCYRSCLIPTSLVYQYPLNPYPDVRGHTPGECRDLCFKGDDCTARLRKRYPYCQQGGTPQECYDQCRVYYDTKDVDGRSVFSYGVNQDLNHNITAVYNGEGRRVIRNQYGSDPADISFDRVTDQWMGEVDSEENHVRLSYHDLTVGQAVAWKEMRKSPSPSLWGDLLCGTAYAGEDPSAAMETLKPAPSGTEEVLAVSQETLPPASDPLCASLCDAAGEVLGPVRICQNTPCLNRINDVSLCLGDCLGLHPSLGDQCRDVCENGKSYETVSKKGLLDACMANLFREHPDCEGPALQGENPSVPVGTPEECHARCRDLYETTDEEGNPRYAYGARQDPDRNLIAVYDDEGLKVDIGEAATVETQTMPAWTGTVPSPVTGLADVGAAGVEAKPSFFSEVLQAFGRWIGNLDNGKGPMPDRLVRPLSPLVQGLDDFKSRTICPQLGHSQENPPYHYFPVPDLPDPDDPPGPYMPQMMLMPLALQAEGPFSRMFGWFAPSPIHLPDQVPVLATVVEDLHGGKRAYYLNKQMRLLREVLFRSNGPGNDQPYETTDYNYILKPGRTDRAVLYPSGEKVCTVSTAFDLPQSVTHSPAPGYEGEKGPRTINLEYDSEGNLAKLARQDGWSVTYVRDQWGRVQEIKTTVDPANNKVVTATNTYAGNQDVLPSQVTMPDGSVMEQADFDPWGIFPKKVTLDKNGAAPMRSYADYYPTGRIKEQGTVGQSGGAWDYYDNFLPKTVKVRKDPNSPWRETGYTYDGANQIKTISTPELTRRMHFDPLGNLDWTLDLPNDNISDQKKSCFNYSPDGRLLARMYPKGNVSEYAYDPAGRVAGVKMGFPETPPEWAGDCLPKNGSDPQMAMNLGLGMNAGPDRDSPLPYAKRGMEEVASFTYKPGGFLERVRQGGLEETFVTDGYGRVIDRIDPNGSHHRVGYSLFDDQVLWTADYDARPPAFGKPNFPNASLLAASEFEYDGLDRLKTISRWHFADGRPVGADLKLTTRFGYDDANHVVTATSNGLSTTTRYDGLGRVLSQILPDNSKATAQWNSNLNQVVWNRPGPHGNNMTTTEVFDGLGLLSKVIDDQGQVVVEEIHDTLGRVIESRPLASGAAHFTYDSFGRPYQTRQEVVQGIDIVLTSLWGKNNEPVGFIDGNGNLTQNRYDGLGRLAASLDANGRVTRYEYVPGTGLLHKAFLPDGNNPVPDASSTEITHEYDAGLLKKQSVRHGANVVNYGNQTTIREFTYTPLGQIATAKLTDANNGAVTNQMTNTLVYDSLENVILEKNSLLPFEIRHILDPANRKSTTILNKELIEKTFDKLGRLETVALNAQAVASFQYVGLGGPVGLTYGNGTVGAFAYDNRGFLIDTVVKDKNQNPLLSVHMAYGLDGSPRLKQVALGKAGPVKTDLFQVDHAGRLIAEASGFADSMRVGQLPAHPNNADVQALIDDSPLTQKYALDPASNWRRVEKNVKGAITSWTFTPDKANAYTMAEGLIPQYDPAGNLTAFPANNPTESYTYNGLGQLLDATVGQKTSGFYYDALGRRVAKMNTQGDFTYYLWNEDILLASGDNRLDAESFTLNLMAGPTTPLASAGHLGKDAKTYFHAGPDGSVGALSDAQSDLIEGVRYNAYGQPTFLDADGQTERTASKSGNRFLFQGMAYDADTALYLTPARAYKPAWGRWLNRDPIGLAGGQNLYAFVDAQPLDFADPSGWEAKKNKEKNKETEGGWKHYPGEEWYKKTASPRRALSDAANSFVPEPNPANTPESDEDIDAPKSTEEEVLEYGLVGVGVGVGKALMALPVLRRTVKSFLGPKKVKDVYKLVGEPISSGAEGSVFRSAKKPTKRTFKIYHEPTGAASQIDGLRAWEEGIEKAVREGRIKKGKLKVIKTLGKGVDDKGRVFTEHPLITKGEWGLPFNNPAHDKEFLQLKIRARPDLIKEGLKEAKLPGTLENLEGVAGFGTGGNVVRLPNGNYLIVDPR